MTEATHYLSPVGLLTIAATDNRLTGLWIENQKYFPSKNSFVFSNHLENTVLKEARLWLDRYFSGQKPLPSELPLAPSGSDFRKEVWEFLCDIPYGKTTTYGEIAKKMALRRGLSSMSAQAVGGAVGHNPISIIIPCHRVVGANGGLAGYAGGVEVKKKLLEIEALGLRV